MNRWVSFEGIGIGKIYFENYAFKLFGLEIRWYALIISFGILISALIAIKLSKKFGIKKEQFIDVIIGGIVFGVIGARVYYVVFNFEEFSKNLISIFNLRSGGLAIYGTVIFSFAFGFLYCKVKNIPFLPIADNAGICFLIGQAIGRWGNFFNIEAYGVKTNLPWGMSSSEIDSSCSPVHPTFFYESLWCFIGFFVLLFFIKYRKFDGQIFLNYIVWYSFERFFVEGLRADSLWLVKDFIRVSQALSFVLFFLAILTEIYVLFFYMKKNKDKNFLYVNFLKEKDLEVNRIG